MHRATAFFPRTRGKMCVSSAPSTALGRVLVRSRTQVFFCKSGPRAGARRIEHLPIFPARAGKMWESSAPATALGRLLGRSGTQTSLRQQPCRQGLVA